MDMRHSTDVLDTREDPGGETIVPMLRKKITIRLIINNELAETLFFLSLFFLLLLTSCAGNSQQRAASVIQQASPAARSNGNVIPTKPGKLQSPAASDYTIGPEDLLEISIFRAPELNAILRVNASGYIRLSLIDKVQAGGLTVAQLEGLLARKLEKFLTEPVVSVFVKEYRSQQITVLGAVKTPGVYYVSGQRNLLDLLSMAGGTTNEAADICIVQRESKTGGSNEAATLETLVIDLSEILVKGHTEFNIQLLSGDKIHVPQSGIFFVDGAIKSPGSFPLKGRMTLTQAISMAKGLAYEAQSDDIKIYRDNGKPEREVLTVNYDDSLSGKGADIELKDKDVIIVPSSGFKNFVKGIAGTLNFGFFSLGKYGGL